MTTILKSSFVLCVLCACAVILFAAQALAEQANVTWVDNSGKNPAINDQESGFPIERNLNGGAFGLLVTVAADSQFYLDSTLFADNAVDNKFCYRVRAINSAGASGFASTATPGVSDCKVVPKRILVIPADPSGTLVK